MRSKTPFIAVIAIAIVAFALLSVFMNSADPAQAAPLAAPTPVSVNHAGTFADVPVFFQTKVITADGGSTVQNVQNHQVMDLQWVVDQTLLTTMNTTTLKIQFSNDGVSWIDGATFATNNVADANDMQQYAVFGRYVRVYADVANTNPLTVTAIGVAK